MKRFGLILAMLMLWLTAFGQQETYRLRQEDVLLLQIYNIDNVRAEMQVGRDGFVTPPFVSAVKAEGLTTKELEAELARLYTKTLRIREPRVSIIILRFRPTRVSVGGAVYKAGQIEIRPGDRVSTAIHTAGGFLPNEAADLRRATLRKASSKEYIPLDLYGLFQRGDVSQDYVLEDGDEINIPENKRNQVFALGEIVQQGPVNFKDGMTLTEVLAIRGGPIPYTTKLSKTIVNRERPGLPGQYERITCDLAKFFGNGDASQNIVLKPGDIVWFSKSATPDVGRISSITSGLANFLFILDRFGVKIFK